MTNVKSPETVSVSSVDWKTSREISGTGDSSTANTSIIIDEVDQQITNKASAFLPRSCSNLTYSWTQGDSKFFFEERKGLELGEYEDVLALQVTYFIPASPGRYGPVISETGTVRTDQSGVRLFVMPETTVTSSDVSIYAENWNVGISFFEGLRGSARKEVMKRTSYNPPECLEDFLEHKDGLSIHAVKLIGHRQLHRISAAIVKPEFSVFDGGRPHASFDQLSSGPRYDFESKSFSRQYQRHLRKFHDGFILQCEWNFKETPFPMRYSESLQSEYDSEQCRVEMLVSPTMPGHRMSSMIEYAIPLTHPDEVYGPEVYKGVDSLLKELKKRALNFCTSRCVEVADQGTYRKKDGLSVGYADLHAAEVGMSFGIDLFVLQLLLLDSGVQCQSS